MKGLKDIGQKGAKNDNKMKQFCNTILALILVFIFVLIFLKK